MEARIRGGMPGPRLHYVQGSTPSGAENSFAISIAVSPGVDETEASQRVGLVRLSRSGICLEMVVTSHGTQSDELYGTTSGTCTGTNAISSAVAQDLSAGHWELVSDGEGVWPNLVWGKHGNGALTGS